MLMSTEGTDWLAGTVNSHYDGPSFSGLSLVIKKKIKNAFASSIN